MSTLEQRTRAVARAGADISAIRIVGGCLGVAGFGVGVQVNMVGIAAAGAILLGVVIGTLLSNPDRSYLEGFSDGLAAAEDLAALELDRAAGSAGRSEPDPDLRRLPRGFGDDGYGAVDGPLRGPGGEDRGGDEPDPRGGTLATAFGVALEPRPASSPIAPDGAPNVGLSGPRPSPFPAIPAAHVVGGRPAGGVAPIGAAHRRTARPLRSAPRPR